MEHSYATDAYCRMIRANGDAVGFLGLALELAQRVDRAHDLLTEYVSNDSNEAPGIESRVSAYDKFSKFRSYNRSVIYQGSSNNFLTYISDIFEEIIKRYPQILISNEKISYKEVMQFSRIADLRSYIIEKKILQLTHQGVDDLRAEVLSKYNFDLFPKSNVRKRISRLIERRNLLVHAYGKVNRRYIERTGDQARSVGQIVKLERSTLLIKFLAQVAYDIDVRAQKKFKLKKVRLPHPGLEKIGLWINA